MNRRHPEDSGRHIQSFISFLVVDIFQSQTTNKVKYAIVITCCILVLCCVCLYWPLLAILTFKYSIFIYHIESPATWWTLI